jgi:molybdopterin adenylyltransferase
MIAVFYDRGVSQLEHKAAAPASIRVAVLTVSDTRSAATDTSGRTIAELLVADGHHVVARALVRDEPTDVTSTVARLDLRGH